MKEDTGALEFFEQYPPQVAALARQTRVLILETLPGLIEQVDPSANLVAYGLDRGYRGLVCGMTLHAAHINLMFARGATLPDPRGLLTGTGKKARHLRIERPADVEQAGVRELLQAAFAVARES